MRKEEKKALWKNRKLNLHTREKKCKNRMNNLCKLNLNIAPSP